MNPYLNQMPVPEQAGPTDTTHPLMRMDPNFGLAPIQMMGLSLIRGQDPVAGLEEFGRLQANALQRQGYAQDLDISKHNLQIAQNQDKRADEYLGIQKNQDVRAAQNQAKELEWKQKEIDFELEMMPLKMQEINLQLQAGALDLRTSRLRLQEAEKLATRSGIQPEKIRDIQEKSMDIARRVLSGEVGEDGFTTRTPSAQEIVLYANELTTANLEYLLAGPGPEGGPDAAAQWGALSPEEQTQFIQQARSGNTAAQGLLQTIGVPF